LFNRRRKRSATNTLSAVAEALYFTSPTLDEHLSTKVERAVEMRINVGGGSAASKNERSATVAAAPTSLATTSVEDFDESSPLRGARGRMGSSSSQHQAELSPETG